MGRTSSSQAFEGRDDKKQPVKQEETTKEETAKPNPSKAKVTGCEFSEYAGTQGYSCNSEINGEESATSSSITSTPTQSSVPRSRDVLELFKDVLPEELRVMVIKELLRIDDQVHQNVQQFINPIVE